jgi:hypothetical protein
MKLSKIILLLIAASLFAQELVIKTDVRLVVVNVSVRDRAGNLVTDLKKKISSCSRTTSARSDLRAEDLNNDY